MSTKHGKKCAHKVDVIQKSYYTYVVGTYLFLLLYLLAFFLGQF